MKKLIVFLTLALSMAAPAHAQLAGVWWPPGAFTYLPSNANRMTSDRRWLQTIFDYQAFGNNGAVYPGATNVLGEPLQYGVGRETGVRSWGYEFVNTMINGVPQSIIKLFVADGEANFNPYSCWQAGCPGNNIVWFLCCANNDGSRQAINLQYSTYDGSAFMQINGGARIYPFNVWRGGQGQGFYPQLTNTDIYQGVPPGYVQYGNTGFFVGGSSMLIQVQWDWGVPQNATEIRSGDVSGQTPQGSPNAPQGYVGSYLMNQATGQIDQWEGNAGNTGYYVEDYWMQ